MPIAVKKILYSWLTASTAFVYKKLCTFFTAIYSRKKLHIPLLGATVLLIMLVMSWAELQRSDQTNSAVSAFFLSNKLATKNTRFETGFEKPLVQKKLVSHSSKRPLTKYTFNNFKELLGYRESGGRYDVVNKLGYLGKFQFGKSTLRVLGIYDTQTFLQSPKLQETAFSLNVARNKWILRNEIKQFKGHRIKGVLITESGIIAAAHLSGPGNVKKFLHSGGGNNVKDAFGTSLQHYMMLFAGFNTSCIPAIRNPRL